MEERICYICLENHTDNNPLLLLCQCKNTPVCKECLIKQDKTHCTICKTEYSNISDILVPKILTVVLWGDTTDDLLQSLNFCGTHLIFPKYIFGNQSNVLVMHDPSNIFPIHKINERKGRIFMLDLFFAKVCGGDEAELINSVAGILKLTNTNWHTVDVDKEKPIIIVKTHDGNIRKYKYSKPSKGFYTTLIK